MRIVTFHHQTGLRVGVRTETNDGPAVVDLAAVDCGLPGDVTALLSADADVRALVQTTVGVRRGPRRVRSPGCGSHRRCRGRAR